MTHKAVYAGTFDILTLGHVWMIKAGARIFDNLGVAIGINPSKKTMFTIDERRAMLVEVVRGLPVTVDTFPEDEFLVNYATSVGARFLLRGIRNGADYEYERMLRTVNSEIKRGATTVFLMPPAKLAVVSSSMVKSLIGPKGWEKEVAKYVPPAVLAMIVEKQKDYTASHP